MGREVSVSTCSIRSSVAEDCKGVALFGILLRVIKILLSKRSHMKAGWTTLNKKCIKICQISNSAATRC